MAPSFLLSPGFSPELLFFPPGSGVALVSPRGFHNLGKDLHLGKFHANLVLTGLNGQSFLQRNLQIGSLSITGRMVQHTVGPSCHPGFDLGPLFTLKQHTAPELPATRMLCVEDYRLFSRFFRFKHQRPPVHRFAILNQFNFH